MSLGTICGTVAAEITYQLIRASGTLTVVVTIRKGSQVIDTVAKTYTRPATRNDEIFEDAIDAIRDAF